MDKPSRALHYAVRACCPTRVLLALHNGADVGARDAKGRTPIAHASAILRATTDPEMHLPSLTPTRRKHCALTLDMLYRAGGVWEETEYTTRPGVGVVGYRWGRIDAPVCLEVDVGALYFRTERGECHEQLSLITSCYDNWRRGEGPPCFLPWAAKLACDGDDEEPRSLFDAVLRGYAFARSEVRASFVQALRVLVRWNAPQVQCAIGMGWMGVAMMERIIAANRYATLARPPARVTNVMRAQGRTRIPAVWRRLPIACPLDDPRTTRAQAREWLRACTLEEIARTDQLLALPAPFEASHGTGVLELFRKTCSSRVWSVESHETYPDAVRARVREVVFVQQLGRVLAGSSINGRDDLWWWILEWAISRDDV